MRLIRKYFRFLGHLCFNCGIIFMISITLFALLGVICTSANYELHFHLYGNWQPARAATCQLEGLEEQRCSCGKTIQRTTGYGDHTMETWQIQKVATSSMPGTRYSKCKYCDYTINSPIHPTSGNGKLGSAGWIGNDTVIISIFADDKNSKWPTNTHGQWLKEQALENLGAAAAWIQEQCTNYGYTPQFYYDWAEDPSLKYRLVFTYLDINLQTSGNNIYKRQVAQIEAFIDSETIKQRYNARNIIYAFFFYEPNGGRSYAYCDIGSRETECVNLMSRSTRTIAHELLHCFGAPDLYNGNHMIPQPYIDYAKANYPNDIMLTTKALEHATLSPIDAYYLGLLTYHPHVEAWNLATTTHTNRKYVKN